MNNTQRYRTKSDKLLAKEKKCLDKKTYFSEEEAEGAGLHMKSLFGDQQYAYYCNHCSLFHLSKTKSVDLSEVRKDKPSVAELYRQKIEELNELKRPQLVIKSGMSVEVDDKGHAYFNKDCVLKPEEAMILSLWLKDTFSGVNNETHIQ